MRTFFLLTLFVVLMVPLASVQAAEAPATQAESSPGTAQAPAKASGPGHAANARSDAAEARYKAWLEQEHAKDAAAFAKEKSVIEDKYKGYVRPPREKKDAKPAPAPKSE